MFRPHAMSDDSQRAFEAEMMSELAPLPWDGVFVDDARIAIIDDAGNEVLFVLVGTRRDRAMRLARAVIDAVNLRGGYVAVAPAMPT